MDWFTRLLRRRFLLMLIAGAFSGSFSQNLGKFAMMMAVCFVVFAFMDNDAKWDALSVHWDKNVLTYPKTMPRTVKNAIKQGFKIVGSGECGGSNKFLGIPYAKDGDYSVTLLFDVNGYIAGIQAGINRTERDRSGFPYEFQMPPFTVASDKNDRYVVSVYFTEPSYICIGGRTNAQFQKEGTGTGLWIQNGDDDIMKVPNKQKKAKSPWVAGKCSWTIGRHYWYDTFKNMNCKEFFPLFLIYNNRELNGFGWAFNSNLEGKFYERSTGVDLEHYMKEVPTCMENSAPMSIMHVFLTKHSCFNFC